MKHKAEISIECANLTEKSAKSVHLSRLSDLSVETLGFLASLDLPRVDQKLKSSKMNQMALKSLI